MRPRAAGADLSPASLLSAYAAGFFPMATGAAGVIRWYSPDPRAVIPLETFRLPRSARRLVAAGVFTIRTDTAFLRVLEGCADREETWISGEIISAYAELHRLGYAHSVECWQGEELAGGLYGVSLGAAFFGESMFSAVSGASKVALAALVDRLRAGGYLLLDTQWLTPHLRRLGALEIPRDEYLELLGKAVDAGARWETDVTL